MSGDSAPTSGEVEAGLRATHALLDRHRIWHCVTYGTLLGGVRDGRLIPWDYDFDLFVRPTDLRSICSLAAEAAESGLSFQRTCKSPAELAMGAAVVGVFDPMRVVVSSNGKHLGDMFAPSLFSDGVLRMIDFAREAVWTPHCAIPHFFLAELGTVTIEGNSYPGVGHPERFLESVYGADWRIPYRSALAGGELTDGRTVHGDRYEPTLAADIDWCLAQGWDRSVYTGLPEWPRAIQGAGPIGPTTRTLDTSRSTWWRDLDELVAEF